MKYSASTQINTETAECINKMLGMTPDELYQKYGYKRDELLFSTTADFSNGYFMDINVRTCDDAPPYIDMVLYDNNSNEINCDVRSEPIEGEYHIDDNGDEYCVVIVIM